MNQFPHGALLTHPAQMPSADPHYRGGDGCAGMRLMTRKRCGSVIFLKPSTAAGGESL
jgi:hypothetical protein